MKAATRDFAYLTWLTFLGGRGVVYVFRTSEFLTAEAVEFAHNLWRVFRPLFG